MKRILFFDTETTGMIARNLPPEHYAQPRIVQLGAILAREDGTEELALNAMIRPDGWTIPPKTTEIHHITTQMCQDSGWPLKAAMSYFVAMAKSADLAVAHNIDFDVFMVDGEAKRAGITFGWPPDRFCTMKSATNLVKAPKSRGTGFKYPNLTETYKHFFGTVFDDAHDAIADVRACAKCYFKIINQESP